jgi:bacterioferritin (cytochrome b1)
MVIMVKISLKAGPPVEGADFYGREKELQYAWEYHISKSVSLLLSAPRRVGKTSFSKRMLKMAEENGWKTLYLDLEGISTESEFVKLFKKEFKPEKWFDKTGGVFLKIVESIEELNIAGNGISINYSVWRSDTYGKIRQLIENTERVLIVIDEFTVYLNHLLTQENGIEKVEFFLEWLRSFRQTKNVSWIFCSSVGIENFASMHQLSKHLNDLHSYPIGAFSENEAKDFISRLIVDENVQFTEDHIQYILDKLVWHLPFFIQLLAEKINFLVYIEGKQLSNETIDEAYNLLITESYFNTWDERLKYYDEFEDNARKILKLCASPNGRIRNDLLMNISAKEDDEEEKEVMLSKLLGMLQNDGYLAERDGKYIFRSPLLRDFWHARFIK